MAVNLYSSPWEQYWMVEKPSITGAHTYLAQNPSIASASAPAAAAAGSSGGGTLAALGGLSGVAATLGAGAQIYNAYKQGLFNDRMIKEQKKINQMYMDEYHDRKKAQNDFQSNLNSVWG